MEVTSCPPELGCSASRLWRPTRPRLEWGCDRPKGLDPLSHHELGLDVRVDFRLPDGVLEVETQASSLTGASSSGTAAAVAAAGFAAGGPVVGTPGVPPGLPSQALLLQQELETFHFTACGAVLCLSQTVSCKGRQAPVSAEAGAPITVGEDLERRKEAQAHSFLYSYGKMLGGGRAAG